MRRTTLAAALGMLASGCQPPPPDNNTPTVTTTTETGTPVPTTTTSTTFPTDTTFGGPQDVEPDHWLHTTETGLWTLTPSGGPYTGLTGTFTLQEIVDELDVDEGPDCLVTWMVDGTEPINPGTCAGCDPAIVVAFTVSTGDVSTCQSPDLPPGPSEPAWRLAWNPTEQVIYRNMNGTAVWVAWWPAIKTADTLDILRLESLPIVVEEEM